MEIALSLQSLLIGLGMGLMLFDWHLRKKARDDIETYKSELAATLKTIIEAHNNLTNQVKTINDKLTAHEFRLTQPVTRASSPR
jgi:hypothetical protein